MFVTVSQLCTLPLFKKSIKLIAGSEGLAHSVQQVTIMETPGFADFDQLLPNTFLLSTLFTFTNEREYVCETFKKLAKKNVAAMGIKTRRIGDKVPPFMIEAADLYNLPLFLISDELPFSIIITTITSEVINEQFNTLKNLDEQHSFFLSLVLKGTSDVRAFMGVLWDMLGKSCVCISSSGEILAEFGDDDFRNTKAADVDFLNDFIKNQTSFSVAPQVDDYHIFPCYARDMIIGYLIIKDAENISMQEMLYIQQTVSYLSIILLEKRIEFETEQRILISIADEIFFRRYSEDSIIRDRVQRLGLTPQKFHFVLVVQFKQDVTKSFWENEGRPWVKIVKDLFPNSAIFIKADAIVCIISFSDKDVYTNELVIKRVLRNAVQSKDEVDIGYSLIVDDLTKLVDCYEQAKKAVLFGRAFKPDTNIFPYSEFIDKGLIWHSLSSPEHKLIIKNIIDPIKKYDTKYNSQLWLTLEKCIVTGSLEKVAQDIHIHPSTLRYRLQRLHDITAVDFFSSEGRFLFNLAYILSKM